MIIVPPPDTLCTRSIQQKKEKENEEKGGSDDGEGKMCDYVRVVKGVDGKRDGDVSGRADLEQVIVDIRNEDYCGSPSPISSSFASVPVASGGLSLVSADNGGGGAGSVLKPVGEHGRVSRKGDEIVDFADYKSENDEGEDGVDDECEFWNGVCEVGGCVFVGRHCRWQCARAEVVDGELEDEGGFLKKARRFRWRAV